MSMIIGLGGDVMIGRLINENLKESPPSYVWGNLLPILQSTDFNLINLETTLTESKEIVPKVFNFKSEPKNVCVLKEGKIDMVNLANNHVLDYGIEGLLETVATLDKAGIKHVGAGKNWQDAVKPAYFDCRGLRIGVLGCTDNEPGWKASSQPGTFYLKIDDLSAIKENIQSLRPHVDLLIVSLHWGPNMKQKPSAEFRAFAHQLIDVGADLIHGHSAHIFQGVEVYNKKFIFYDTGDLVDDYAVDPILRNDRSFFFLIEAKSNELLGFRLIPVLISAFQVNQMSQEEAKETLERMQKLSAEFGTQLQCENGALFYKNL